MTPIQRAAWTAHCRTRAYRARVERARDLMRAHPKYALSISWGKDSVAMLHLACQALDHVIAVHGRYSPQEELPDIPDVRDKMLAMLGDRVTYIETPVWGEWEMYEAAGRFFLELETPEDRRWLKKWKDGLVDSIEGAAREAGAEGMMIGMAAHESRARRLNIAVRGERYSVNGRLPTLLPLARWSADDVCAYHIEHDLPWLRIYDIADDPRLARSEIAFAAGGRDSTRRHGGWAEWRRAYPDLWRVWDEKWGLGRLLPCRWDTPATLAATIAWEQKHAARELGGTATP